METSERSLVQFFIKTEVSPNYSSQLLLYIYQEYVAPLYTRFTNVRRWVVNEQEVLAFTLTDKHNAWYVNIEISAGEPIQVQMTPEGNVPRPVLSRLKEDLIIAVQMFEEKLRQTTLYFAWVPDKKVIPEKTPDKRRKIMSRIFMGNMLLFFVIFIVLSYGIFILLTEVLYLPVEYFPAFLVLIQFITVLFSHKIVGRMGDWQVTASNPYVHVLQYHIPPEQFETFRNRYDRNTLLRVKREIQIRALGKEGPVDVEVAKEVFETYGIKIRQDSLLTKKVDVYQLVKEAAERFRMPIPKIMISNVIIPNAAATGASPRFGLILLTTGLLVQLDKNEIQAVVGHEMSHVRSRDPLALFALVSVEYMFRIYFLWNFIYFFGLIYFFFALGAIYFIAKFFEARADLDSAIKLGHPELLAEALRKIGYRKIQIERLQTNIIGSWIGLNPHPPVSFRVERLENLNEPQRIKHTFLQSIKDCIKGLLDEFRRL